MKFPINESVDSKLTRVTSTDKDRPVFSLCNWQSTMERHSDDTYRCRQLTSMDVHQALQHFKIDQAKSNSSASRTEQVEVQSSSTCHCCSLLRSNQSARLSFPSASRRARRSHLSSQSLPLQCEHCSNSEDKPSATIDHDEELASKNIFETISDLDRTSILPPPTSMITRDLLHELEFSLINEQERLQVTSTDYEPAAELSWKINTSDNAIEHFCDTGTLAEKEKRILLRQTIEKLQLVLNNRPTSTTLIPDFDLDKIELTYGALQSTIDILISSLNAIH